MGVNLCAVVQSKLELVRIDVRKRKKFCICVQIVIELAISDYQIQRFQVDFIMIISQSS
jgi:hypothetical protein